MKTRRKFLGPIWPASGPDYNENPYRYHRKYWPETVCKQMLLDLQQEAREIKEHLAVIREQRQQKPRLRYTQQHSGVIPIQGART